jgi:hypothetical protein
MLRRRTLKRQATTEVSKVDHRELAPLRAARTQAQAQAQAMTKPRTPKREVAAASRRARGPARVAVAGAARMLRAGLKAARRLQRMAATADLKAALWLQ